MASSRTRHALRLKLRRPTFSHGQGVVEQGNVSTQLLLSSKGSCEIRAAKGESVDHATTHNRTTGCHMRREDHPRNSPTRFNLGASAHQPHPSQKKRCRNQTRAYIYAKKTMETGLGMKYPTKSTLCFREYKSISTVAS